MPQKPNLPCPALLRIMGMSLALGPLVLCSACAKLAVAVGVTSSVSLTSSVVSSDILSSPFRSSSRSGDEREDEEIEEEVQIYTAGYLKAGVSDTDSFKRGLHTIAARHGVGDWEASPSIWIGVGRGLATAKLGVQLTVAYVQSWSGHNPQIVELLEQGYASVSA